MLGVMVSMVCAIIDSPLFAMINSTIRGITTEVETAMTLYNIIGHMLLRQLASPYLIYIGLIHERFRSASDPPPLLGISY